MEPPDGAHYQARYSELWPSRDAGDDPDDVRVSLILPDPEVAAQLGNADGESLRATERGELEIDAVVRVLRRRLGLDGTPALTIVDPVTGEIRAAEPRDIAIIVRKIDWGDRLLDRLRRVGIPATIAGGRRFWAREEIQTLATLLEAIVDPENRLARFASLRSPALGFRDDELVLSFLHEQGHFEGEPPADVADATERLRQLSADARRLPVPDFLESLAEELSLLSVFGLRPDGPGRVESLRILLEAADAFVEAGLDSLPGFVRWLKQQTGAPGVEGPGEPDPGEQGGVQILTIHKAKGLEFPIVVLADLAGRAQTRETIVADRVAGRIEFRLSQPAAVETPGFAEAWEEERLRQKAEEVRLLYVAMTRARDHRLLAWPEGAGGFLERGDDGELARRVGSAPGEPAPAESGVGTIRVEALPPLEDVRSRTIAEPDRTVAAPSPARDATEARRLARRGVRVLAATSVGTPPRREDPPWADLPLFAPGPGGREFGSLIHRALEIWDAGASDARGVIADAARIVAPRLARESGQAFRFGEEDLDEAVRYLERITADPAVTAVWSAPRIFREVPFVLPLGEDLVAGTIDVLVEGRDGTLSIVDWKTDRIGRRSGDAAKERYRGQALTYAHAAAQITGRRVREVRFLFLSSQPVETGSFRPGPDFGGRARAVLGAARMV
jgi:ATP-dependent helicase/nuclease subunit A